MYTDVLSFTKLCIHPIWLQYLNNFSHGQAYEPQSVNDVMVHHAKDLVDQNNMQVGGEHGKLKKGHS